MRSNLWECLPSLFSVNLREVELSCFQCVNDLQLFILCYADVGSVVPLLSEYLVSILSSQDVEIQLYASHRCLLVWGGSWDHVVLILCGRMDLLPLQRANVLLGRWFMRLGGKWANNHIFSMGLRTCQTCQCILVSCFGYGSLYSPWCLWFPIQFEHKLQSLGVNTVF